MKKAEKKFAGSIRLEQHIESTEQIVTKYKEESDKLKTPLEGMLNALLKLRQVQMDAEDPDSIYYHEENNSKSQLIAQLEDSYKLFKHAKSKLVASLFISIGRSYKVVRRYVGDSVEGLQGRKQFAGAGSGEESGG
eukprot:TRINITY_DN10744_c0_g3_i1.p1 TRINITY_DN10744_c0_g3~~TRINITY_DN10744_c0_g3_i1.p1  ORF type:complete len:136 (-),score=19.34 TRINITY_DN10744_c0_g3_i1:175-582(-)